MKFQHTQVSNFENAIRGLRNPLESWEKSDSLFGIENIEYCNKDYQVAVEYINHNEKYDFIEECDKFNEALDKYSEWIIKNGVLKMDHDCIEYAFLGPNDLNLAQRMVGAGTSDSKFMRQIFISVDITAPLYFWKQLDTYKISTTANSTSTMHKLASTPITFDCFETDDIQDVVIEDSEDPTFIVTSNYAANTFINWLEELRLKYVETKDKKYWKELVRWLPNSWLQTRTWTANYATLRNIYFQRRYHKLSEWHQFCEWVESLPYSAELITYINKKEQN